MAHLPEPVSLVVGQNRETALQATVPQEAAGLVDPVGRG